MVLKEVSSETWIFFSWWVLSDLILLHKNIKVDLSVDQTQVEGDKQHLKSSFESLWLPARFVLMVTFGVLLGASSLDLAQSNQGVGVDGTYSIFRIRKV